MKLEITPEHLAKLLHVGCHRGISKELLEKYIADMPDDLKAIARGVAGGPIPIQHMAAVLAIRTATEKK